MTVNAQPSLTALHAAARVVQSVPMNGAIRRWIVPMVLSIAIGAAVVITGAASEPSWIMACMALALIPLLVFGSARQPGAVVAFLVAAQILKGYELATPLMAVSAGSIAVVVFLAVRYADVVASFRLPGVGLFAALISVFVAAHLVQFLHVDPALAARRVVTIVGFAAYGIVGAYAVTRPNGLRNLAAGATVALVLLSATALLVATGIFVPPGASLSPARDLFGILNPLDRTYGFPVEPHSVSVLLPLAVPFLTVSIIRPNSQSLPRLVAIIALVSVTLASEFLFQARAMLMELMLGVAVPAVMLQQIPRGVAVVALAAITVSTAWLGLTAGDTSVTAVSSQLRSESMLAAVSYLVSHPSAILIGMDPDAFHILTNANLTFASQIQQDAPVHNVLIEEVVAGGAVAGIALMAIPTFVMWRVLLAPARATLGYAQAIAVAATVMVVADGAVNPANASSAGLWLTLGMSAALAAGSLYRQTERSPE